MSLVRWLPFFGVLLAMAMSASGQVRADHPEKERDAVRSAVESGKIRPLAEIIAALRGKLPGEIAGVELERGDGPWLYEFRIVDDKGRLFDALVDAKTGEIQQIKEK